MLLFHDNYPKIAYDPSDGLFYKADENGLSVSTPDDRGYLYCFIKDKDRVNLKKASHIAWEFIYKKDIPDGHLIFHKDLDTTNYQACNIALLDKKIFKRIKEALNIVSGGIKLEAHKDDNYKYIIKWREEGIGRQLICHDMSGVRKAKRRIILRNTKIISEHVILN